MRDESNRATAIFAISLSHRGLRAEKKFFRDRKNSCKTPAHRYR
jgi:hypothetical protein